MAILSVAVGGRGGSWPRPRLAAAATTLLHAGHLEWAEAALADAHAEFAGLGALPWADRALAELRAAGGRAAAGISEVAALQVLSPQEQQVARLVADGATSQEAATALFLSQKSIERHLTTTDRKLGLRSRTELARWFDLTSSPADREATSADRPLNPVT